MATATATAGGGSNNNRAMLNAKERGAEVIGMDGNNKEDCEADAGSLSTAVFVDGGGNGMEPMEPIGINQGYGKDVIAAAAINCRCSQRWPPLPPLMTNDNRWLLAVIIINCAAAAMKYVDTGDSGHT